MNTRTKERGKIISKLRREEGASMVEFALVAPLLLVLLFGIIEFGLILYDQAAITNASREGARYAAMYYINPSTNTPQQHSCSDIQSYVTNYVNPILIGISPTSYTVSCPYVNQNDGSVVGYATQVQVSYNYNFLVFGGLLNLINGSITNPLALTATTVMRDDNQTNPS
jgi:Flp pilus assembly protein TadG